VDGQSAISAFLGGTRNTECSPICWHRTALCPGIERRKGVFWRLLFLWKHSHLLGIQDPATQISIWNCDKYVLMVIIVADSNICLRLAASFFKSWVTGELKSELTGLLRKKKISRKKETTYWQKCVEIQAEISVQIWFVVKSDQTKEQQIQSSSGRTHLSFNLWPNGPREFLESR